MDIALASDHAGYQIKDHLVKYLEEQGHHVYDLGVDTPDVRSDYPDVAEVVASSVLDGTAQRGILVCGSGVGASIAANKFTGIYAAICHDIYSAFQGVEHDNMNVLCLGGRLIGPTLAEGLADAFLNAQFIGKDRYLRRFEKLQSIERTGRGNLGLDAE